MGYESKLYVVEKSTLPSEDGLTYAAVVAMVDMCKLGCSGELPQLIRKSDPTKYYIYGTKDDKLTEDSYGDPLKEMTLEATIAALEADNDGYRRILPALALLKSFNPKDWRDLAVLHFGY